jgi:hypothetical protein
MSYGSHESSQYAEVSAKDDDHEAEFQLTLNCVSLGCKAQLYGEPGDCYPAEAAEFELESVHVLDDEGKPHLISEDILKAVVGEDVARQMVEDAETEAMESGEF